MATFTFKIYLFACVMFGCLLYTTSGSPQYQQPQLQQQQQQYQQYVTQYQQQQQQQQQQQLQQQQPQQFQAEGPHNILDIETPTSFNYNSPLRQPDSLRSRPYFDFLSTLYRRDSAKSDLFRPYARTRRDTEIVSDTGNTQQRQRRAILFRPLFVYKQQQVRKEQTRRRRI